MHQYGFWFRAIVMSEGTRPVNTLKDKTNYAVLPKMTWGSHSLSEGHYVVYWLLRLAYGHAV